MSDSKLEPQSLFSAENKLPTDKQVSSLRLLSYNIQVAAGSSCFRHYITHCWKHVLPHYAAFDVLDQVAALVSDFDLVALQEVDAGSLRSYFINQVEYLAHRADFPFWHYQTNRRLGSIAQHSNGLLSRARPHEVVHYKLPGLIPGRGALLACYGNPDNPLAVVQVHLALGRRARVNQLAMLAELVDHYEHFVLMGDFNCQAQSGEMQALLSRTGLQLATLSLNTFPSWQPQRNIDHILVSPSLSIRKAQALNHYLSDHLPVAVEVEVPDELQINLWERWTPAERLPQWSAV